MCIFLPETKSESLQTQIETHSDYRAPIKIPTKLCEPVAHEINHLEMSQRTHNAPTNNLLNKTTNKTQHLHRKVCTRQKTEWAITYLLHVLRDNKKRQEATDRGRLPVFNRTLTVSSSINETDNDIFYWGVVTLKMQPWQLVVWVWLAEAALVPQTAVGTKLCPIIKWPISHCVTVNPTSVCISVVHGSRRSFRAWAPDLWSL